MNNDKLIIGGHEFDSRFILGSGKYSLKLIDAAVKDAGAEIITLSVRRANTKEHENILDYIPKGVTLCRTHRVQEMQTRLFALHEWLANSVAATSLKSKLCAIQNIFSPTMRKR